MKTFLLCGALVSFAWSARADTNAWITSIEWRTRVDSLTNTSGQVIAHVRLIRADPKGIVYAYTNRLGGGTVPLKDLPDSELVRLDIPLRFKTLAADQVKAQAAAAAARAAAQAEAARKAALSPTDQRRLKYVEAHPELAESVRANILSGHISLGMSRAEVAASWGAPERKSEYVSRLSDSETWFYSKTWVHFSDGKLSSWTSSE